MSGQPDPTAHAIADHAGITRRTLFRHFKDMETLHREVILDAQAFAQLVMDEPFPGDPQTTDQWQTLLPIVIERRVRIYEYLLPLHLSSLFHRYRSSTTEQAIRNNVLRRRKRLRKILPRELTQDALLFESLDGILSIEFWISLRQEQRLSIARARQVLEFASLSLTQAASHQ
jgi:AcrR family transcriptional regulator